MQPEPITQSKLIVVEGDDDRNLLSKLIQHLHLSGIQIIPCIGKGEMPDVIRAVRQTPNFDNKVVSLGVVRDADEDAQHTFESVCNALKTVGLSVPKQPLTVADGTPRVIVMIWPCNRKQGMLEDVCLQSIADYPEMSCIDQYFKCLDSLHIEMPRNLSKAKVKAFLASRPESCLHLGVAAKKGYWPFDSNAFDEIKQFLTTL